MNDLIITCEDIYPMDLGTSGYTEFKMTPEVSSYIANNIELFDCETGLVHSHHQMAAFFSGTDISTLQTEGNDTNCFVSLIVNTAGTYCAAITRKVKAKRTVTINNNEVSYEFFGEGKKSIDQGIVSDTKEITSEEIQYFMLDVERHEISNHLDFLDQRFEEIKAKKNTRVSVNSIYKDLTYKNPFDKAPYTQNDWITNLKKANPEEQYLFDNKTMKELETDTEYHPDSKMIHAAVCRMVTTSLTINAEKFDMKQWIKRHMNNVYKKVFTDDEQFQEWLDFIVPFCVYHFIDFSAPVGVNNDEYYSIIASAMIEELTPFNTFDLPYIQHYITELETLLI